MASHGTCVFVSDQVIGSGPIRFDNCYRGITIVLGAFPLKLGPGGLLKKKLKLGFHAPCINLRRKQTQTKVCIKGFDIYV